MFDKSSDRITAIIPFLIIFFAATIGMKSNIDLFSWWHVICHSKILPYDIQHEHHVR